MRSGRRYMQTVAVLFALFIAAVGLFYGCNEGTGAKSTTVLVYIQGTNLEEDDAQGTQTIKEILAAKASPDVNIVICTGAAYKDAKLGEPVSTWKKVKRHVVRNGKLVEVADLGNADMGKTSALTDFIVWAQTNYPADRYMLTFWDHGGGALAGYGGHTYYPKNSTQPSIFMASSMGVSDIEKAIADAVAVTGEYFELVHFDTCLMATVEVAYALRNYARYLVASEDLEQGCGINWTQAVNFIVDNPSASGEDIGKVISDGYLEKTKVYKIEATATYSVTRLDRIDSLVRALNSFANTWSSNIRTRGSAAWYDLAFSRSRSMDFYTSSLGDIYIDMVDLLDFVDKPMFQSPEVEAIREALSSCVAYKVAGPDRNAACGLSVMFPTGSIQQEKNGKIYASLPFSSIYQAFIKDYSSFALSGIPKAVLGMPTFSGGEVKATVSTPYLEQSCFALVKREGVGSPEYFYAHQPIRVDASNNLTFSWTSGKWMTLNGLLVSLFEEPGYSSLITYRIPVQISFGPTPEQGFIYMLFNYETRESVFQGFLRDSFLLNGNGLMPARGLTKLEPGTTVKPLRYDMTNGNWIAANDSFTIDDSGLKIVLADLPAGDYNGVFYTEDYIIRKSYSPTIALTK